MGRASVPGECRVVVPGVTPTARVATHGRRAHRCPVVPPRQSLRVSTWNHESRTVPVARYIVGSDESRGAGVTGEWKRVRVRLKDLATPTYLLWGVERIQLVNTSAGCSETGPYRHAGSQVRSPVGGQVVPRTCDCAGMGVRGCYPAHGLASV